MKQIDDVKFGLLLGDALGVDRVKQAAAWLKDGLRTSVHFHPVVVMEADLRMIRGKKLTTVPWLRLELRSIDGNIDRWVDVVNAGAFNEYADALTAAYVEKMSGAGAKRWRRKRRKPKKGVRRTTRKPGSWHCHTTAQHCYTAALHCHTAASRQDRDA